MNVSAPPPLEVFDSGPPPVAWRDRWARLPRGARRLVVGVAVLVLLAAAVLWYRDRAAEQALARRVALTTSIGVWASSSAPPRGELNYFLLARNDGPRPLALTAADGRGGGLRLRLRDGATGVLAPGESTVIPVSVSLTCGPEVGRASDDGLPTDLTVRREDGESVVRQIELGPAGPLREVAAMLCDYRPELRDLELSGPVLRVGE